MKIKKCVLLGVVLFISQQAISQYGGGDYLNSWTFSYGRSGTPGDALTVGLEVAKGQQTSVYFHAATEFSRTKGLRYSNVGIGASYRYYIVGDNNMTSPSRINLALGLGAVAQYENEPSLYKGMKFGEKVNYGGQGQILGEYIFDPTVGFMISFEQRILAKEILGKSNYSVAIGLRIHFGND